MGSFPGTGSRNGDCIIRARPVAPISGPIAFGDAVFGYYYSPIPGGVMRNTQALTSAVTGISHTTNVIDGLPMLSTLFNNYGPQIGMTVLGTGVQLDTKLIAFTNTSITLSQPTTSSVSSTFTLVNAVIGFGGGSFGGIALREVLSATTYPAPGLFTYSPAQQIDVLERGSVNLYVQQPIGVAAFSQVYLRIGINPATPWLQIGGYEGELDGLYNLPLPQVSWTTGIVDASGMAEASILVRNQG